MWISLITSFIVFGVVLTDTPKCCSDGSVIMKNKFTTCWNPKNNNSIPISLTCKKRVRKLNYLINEAEELVFRIFNTENIAINRKNYCVGNQTTIKDVDLKNITEVAVVCSEEEKKFVEDEVTGACMIISIIFLVLTAIIYSLLPQLRDLMGKSLIAFCITFALGLTMLAIAKLATYSDMTQCAVRGFLMYYFLLSAIFWTNAISIQILLCMRRPTTMTYKWKDFAWYALYAWGTPAVLTMIVALVNFLPGDHPKPGIGLMHCWFYDKSLQWYYMYSIWAILIIGNIGIFVYTSVCLWRNTFATSHLKSLRYKFTLTLRLFIIMGITWVFEMISSLVDEMTLFWTIIDIYNILQGVTIFLVLVFFRRRVLKAMYKEGWLDCISDRVERYLARVDDDEQDVVDQTREVPLDDRPKL